MPSAIFFLRQVRPVSWPWLATKEETWVPTKPSYCGDFLASETVSPPRPDLASALIAVGFLCEFRNDLFLPCHRHRHHCCHRRHSSEKQLHFANILAAILRPLIIK